jgi:hypothetical protein
MDKPCTGLYRSVSDEDKSFYNIDASSESCPYVAADDDDGYTGDDVNGDRLAKRAAGVECPDGLMFCVETGECSGDCAASYSDVDQLPDLKQSPQTRCPVGTTNINFCYSLLNFGRHSNSMYSQY